MDYILTLAAVKRSIAAYLDLVPIFGQDYKQASGKYFFTLQYKDMNKSQTQTDFPIRWDLSLLYESPNDPQLEKDLEEYNQKRKQFAQKYQN